MVTWYHLSFFAVSVAMLGMAGGAVHVFSAGERWRGDAAGARLPRVALAFGVSIPLCHLANLFLPIPDLSSVVFRLTPLDVASIALSTAVLAVPFVLSGVVITAGLTRLGGSIGRLYASDLLGAATGALLVVPLLEWANLSSAVFGAGAAALGGAICFERATGARRSPIARGLALAAVAACALNATTDRGVGVQTAKGHDVRPVRDQRAIWNAHSFVFVGLPFPDRVPWFWGRGDAPDSTRVTWAGIHIDGAASSPLTHWNGDPGTLDWTRRDVTALPFQLRDGDVGIVGVGAGRDVLAAIGAGARSVTGVEVNRTFLDLLERSHRDVTRIADRDDVRLVHAEGRSYLARSREQFDVLQMSLIDTWAATGAGAFTLTENGLYTREAWGVFLERLRPAGIFSVSRFFDPNNVSEATRLVALGVGSLLDRGVARPAEQLVVVTRGVVATLLLSVDPFAPADLARIREIAEREGFEVAVAPGVAAPTEQLRAIVAAGSERALQDATAHPDYDFRPPTDARPYFFNLLKFGSFLRVRDASLGVVAGNVRATATLLALFALASVLVAAIVGWPLLRVGRPAMGLGAFGASLWYFGSIGAGFMLLQIPLLQRFSVYLGHPTLSYAVILFSMILFTGLGAWLSDRVDVTSPRWRVALPAAIAAASVALALTIPPLVDATVALATPLRCALVVATVAPVATAAGFCFPLGMRLVERISPDATAWMWGVNGATGVLASIAAVAISIAWGIETNLALAAALYLGIAIPAAQLSR